MYSGLFFLNLRQKSSLNIDKSHFDLRSDSGCNTQQQNIIGPLD